MPGGDRTGPAGMGPMTGRGMGYCAGYNVPGYMNPGFGRGFGRGMGYGRGRGGYGRGMGYGRNFAPYPGPGFYGPIPYGPAGYNNPGNDEEIEYLQNTARALEDELKAIKKRLDELSKEEDQG